MAIKKATATTDAVKPQANTIEIASLPTGADLMEAYIGKKITVKQQGVDVSGVLEHVHSVDGQTVLNIDHRILSTENRIIVIHKD